MRGRGCSRDTLTRCPVPGGGGGGGSECLRPEAPRGMPKQPRRGFQRRDENREAASNSMALRRACIFTGTAALTMAGCYEMYNVLNVGGVTTLEWMVLFLFVLLFGWIAFSFISVFAGFAVLLFRPRDPLGIDPDTPL